MPHKGQYFIFFGNEIKWPLFISVGPTLPLHDGHFVESFIASIAAKPMKKPTRDQAVGC
jgi:hypothetical protein